MQVLNDIKHWALLDAKQGIHFKGRNSRPVTLHVNAAGTAAIYIKLESEGAPRLLALVTGRDQIKFVVDGPFAVVNGTPEVQAYILTADGATVHRVVVDLEAYTTLHGGTTRDEAYDKIIEKMYRGMERRFAARDQQLRERELKIERDQRASAAQLDSQQTERDDDGTSSSASPEQTSETAE